MRSRAILAVAGGLLLFLGVGQAAGTRPVGVILVGTPTGNPATDRAKIKVAISRANPGDVIQFAPGTYVIGFEQPSPAINVPIADITILGSSEGTTIRGGEAVEILLPQDGFRLNRGGATVRGLRFESFRYSLLIGEDRPDLGGYTVEENVFENVFVGAFITLQSSEPTRLVDNEFINVGAPFDHAGGILHFTNNTARTTDPAAIPLAGQPLNMGMTFAFPGLSCDDNLYESNHGDGNADGFGFVVFGGTCNGNVIRNNTFTNQTLYTNLDVGTIAFFLNIDGELSSNLVKGNSLEGQVVTGLFAVGVSRSHFVQNSIRGARRIPDAPPPNGPGGTGILLGGRSHGNQVSFNALEDNAFCDVWLQRFTFNNVVREDLSDTVLDRGRRNLVLGRQCRPGAGAEKSADVEAPVTIGAKTEMLLQLRGW